MSYKPHQITTGEQAYQILKDKGLVLIAGEPRTGKTRTALYITEHMQGHRVLVLTKKNAIPGWVSEMAAVGVHHEVTNYEQAHKLSPYDYDLIIVDESHNLNKVGRPTKRFTNIRKLAANKPVILLTGTPAVERLAGLYYQLGVTVYSPFDQHRNFYDFFRAYGIPHSIRINGRDIEQYDRTIPELMTVVQPYMVTLTQADAGITAQVRDEVHVVPLGAETMDVIHTVMADNVLCFEDEDVAFESDMAVRVAVHQIETGALLMGDDIVLLPNTEVVDYIKDTFGDSPDVAIMAHYRSTREKLRQHLPHVTILSSDAHAEGVDLSMYRHFVVANSAFSGAKFIQRRERGVNMNREDTPVIHHIMTDGGISRAVYEAVSEKKDYNLRMFRNARAKYSSQYPQMVS